MAALVARVGMVMMVMMSMMMTTMVMMMVMMTTNDSGQGDDGGRADPGANDAGFLMRVKIMMIEFVCLWW